MNSFTVPLYLLGHAGAIRRVASSPMAIPSGILLVLSAGVARNYDQMWFGESLTWLVMPLLFSLVSGLWVFFFVFDAWRGQPTEGDALPCSRFRPLASFFGLFWMTAPVAWLYAIPVERWYDPVPAAQWNIRLLTVVSLWRVLLMGRVVSVIGGLSFLRGLGKVVLPASLEAAALSFVGSFAGQRIMNGMAGLRNSPAEDVMHDALMAATGISCVALIFSALCFAIWPKGSAGGIIPWRPDPKVRTWQGPFVLLVATAVLCWRVSIAPQQEQRLSLEAKQFAIREDWAGLVAFLSRHQKEEFAPSIVLPPSPYEYWSAQKIPALFRHITPETPAWIRRMYFDYLAVLLPQERFHYILKDEERTDFFKQLETLEGSRELLRRAEAAPP